MTENQHDPAFAESLRTEKHPDRDRPDVAEGVSFQQAVVFGSDEGRDLTADVFTPESVPTEKRPAIVFLPGGSCEHGGPSQFHFHSNLLAERLGFFAVSVDYRLSGEAQFPKALQDTKCAIRWVRSQADRLNIDTERVCVAGGSAGGHLSSMVSTTAGVGAYEGESGPAGFASHANLAVLYNGEFDMWDLIEKGSLIDAMRQFIGATAEEAPEKYDELSSVQRVHPDVPASLLLHGTVDRCVSHEQSVANHEALLEQGVHSEIEIYEGKPHAWFNREPDRTICYERMEQFLVTRFDLGS
jgi:acetyl esterase/lipase